MNNADDAQSARLARLAADNTEPDTSDVCELPAATWAQAEIGRFYRPRKEAVTIRIDADLLSWFRTASGGRGYQTAINAALREHVTKSQR